jgi:hypothetical protein
MVVDASYWSKADFIREMRCWPWYSVSPTTPSQKGLLRKLQNHYQALAKWLEFSVLGREELKPELFFTPLIQWKPYADISVATLAFMGQIHPRIEVAQQFGTSAENLWGRCEYFESQRLLRVLGYYDGKPETNDQGKVKGKRQQFKENTSALNAYEYALTHRDSQNLIAEWPESEKDRVQQFIDGRVDSIEHLTEFLFYAAVRHADHDPDLRFHCHQYLRARKHFEGLTNKGENTGDYQAPYLRSLDGPVHTTGQSKKTPKPIEPKRPRGRPPKGSNVKKY